jgi:hypothetical protein
MSSLADGMTTTLASLANWTGDKIFYQGRNFEVISGPMVLIDGSDLTGSQPARLYQRSIQKKDFPSGPPPEGAKIKINGVEYTRRGDAQEDSLHYVITLQKSG